MVVVGLVEFSWDWAEGRPLQLPILVNAGQEGENATRRLNWAWSFLWLWKFFLSE